jgi:hypothetical protein
MKPNAKEKNIEKEKKKKKRKTYRIVRTDGTLVSGNLGLAHNGDVGSDIKNEAELDGAVSIDEVDLKLVGATQCQRRATHEWVAEPLISIEKSGQNQTKDTNRADEAVANLVRPQVACELISVPSARCDQIDRLLDIVVLVCSQNPKKK